MSLQTSSKYDTSQPYHIYYDIDIVNNDTTGASPPQALRFNEIRNSPYLMSPENYFMSVARFTLQTPTLPVFIPQIQQGQPDSNLTIYSFTMSFTYNGDVYDEQAYMIYTPTDFSQPFAQPPLTKQDLSTEYYYINTFQAIVPMLNATLTTAFNALNADIINKGGVLPTANIPFFEFDPVNLTFILNADQAGFDSALSSPIRIYCNSPLHTLLSSFQFLKYGYSNITAGKNYQFVIASSNGTNIFAFPTYDALQMFQEGSTCGLMNPIQSIVFTTGLLPVVPELISVPLVFNSNTDLFNVGNNANIAPILTDFQVPFSPGNTYKPTIEYTPPGEYRLVDLYGTSPVSAIELSVFWKDQFSNLHPLLLGAGCSANIKLLFRRKDFSNINLYKSL